MINQLLISKKLYLEAPRQHDLNDSVSDGVAVSLLQDSIEIFVWTLIKERSLTVKDNFDFTSNLGTLSAAKLEVPLKPKLLELNKARVNFKHYGNLPARQDVAKFRSYAHQFLMEASRIHFNVDFDDISLVSLIRDEELRTYLLKAKKSVDLDELLPAYEELAKANYLVFLALSSVIPRFSPRDYFPRIGMSELESSTAIAFERFAESLSQLRELLLVSIFRLDLKEYRLADSALPTTVRTVSGTFHINHDRTKYSKTEFDRIYTFLVDICLQQNY
jgi:hypothetical protein